MEASVAGAREVEAVEVDALGAGAAEARAEGAWVVWLAELAAEEASVVAARVVAARVVLMAEAVAVDVRVVGRGGEARLGAGVAAKAVTAAAVAEEREARRVPAEKTVRGVAEEV